MQPTRDKHTGEIVDLAHAVANTYVAHLGGPTVFGDALWAEARQRHWMQARETVVLGDGATWIWNLAADKFFTSRQVVDWYHAKLHLTQAATALHGEGTAAARRWLRDHETPLLQGHAERLAQHPPQTRPETSPLRGRVAPRSRLLSRQLSAHAISRNARRGLSRSAAAWSRVPANNFAPDSPVPACAGHAPAWNACCPFAPRS